MKLLHPWRSSSNHRIFFSYLLLLSLISSHGSSWKTPFKPKDALSLLPRQLSWPLLNSLHSAVDLLPSFVGSVSSSNASVEWKGACFYKNTAWMEFKNINGSEVGGGTLHIKTSDAHSWTCMDLYVFATRYCVRWGYYFLA
eukprot:TRINITY_DN389_c0_g1_i2.p1 TRINITY_DN389_c0_g1~~TRINITY_DN389_c0_g1_i2.p1  ORF type:complete len:155 (-),score=21.21 TRINITY_DN389_c0_g1_i2:261-683(-)